MKSIKLLLPIVAVTITSLASAAERVEVRAGVPSVVVRYDAAALVSRSGIETLHSRLRTAAESVCIGLESRVLGLRELHEQCVRDAIRRGVADVGNENLTNYHRYHALPRALAAN